MNKISHSLALQYKKLYSQICSLVSLLKNTHKSTVLVKFTYFFKGGFIHKSEYLIDYVFSSIYTSSLANHKLCLRGGTAIITICHIQFCWPITFAAINYYIQENRKKILRVSDRSLENGWSSSFHFSVSWKKATGCP